MSALRVSALPLPVPVPAPMPVPLIVPAWPAAPGVGAAMSTRAGGVGTGAWASLNLGAAAGDDAAAVAANRARFATALGATPVWLRQVHGTQVLRLQGPPAAAQAQADALPADAAWTTAPGIACTVLVADCLPVLLCTADGRGVAAAHAGWRGLAGGVLQATVAALAQGSGCAPAALQAGLGPCIGADAFEVGADVLLAFGVHPGEPASPAAGAAGAASCFRFSPRADGAPRWRADLPALALLALREAGLEQVHGTPACTMAGASDFFSFRRDGVTGRMAAAIWRRA
jgi:YfiH family protein